jgi:hypothetical protein
MSTTIWIGSFFLALAVVFGTLGLLTRRPPARTAWLRIAVIFTVVSVVLILFEGRFP